MLSFWISDLKLKGLDKEGGGGERERRKIEDLVKKKRH